MKTIQVYPKGHLVVQVPAGSERTVADAWSSTVTGPWTQVIRNRVRDLIRARLNVFPIAAFSHATADADIISTGILLLRFPKVVVTFTVPNATTHTHIVQAFAFNGFKPWLKARIRNRVPARVTILSWSLTLKTGLGRDHTTEPE